MTSSETTRPRRKDLLLADAPRAEIPVPPRGAWRRQEPPEVAGDAARDHEMDDENRETPCGDGGE